MNPVMAGGDVASLTRTATRRFELGAIVPGLTTFTAVAWIGIANGGYFATEWGWAALGFVLLALLAILGRERVTISRLEWRAVLALGGLASWTLLSVVWSPSAAQPVLAFERTSVYVLALLAVLLVSTSKTSAVGLVSGVLAGTVVVCADGLLTYPGQAGWQPIGYANGIGILAAIGLLVALGLAANTVGRHRAGACIRRSAAARRDTSPHLQPRLVGSARRRNRRRGARGRSATASARDARVGASCFRAARLRWRRRARARSSSSPC